MASTRGRNQVNLDALIPRADLFETSETVVPDTKVIRISDLKPGVIYEMLRKPDFQRETDRWTPKQVVRLIKTFAASEIIPTIILWQSGNKIFVVDGAHRLSALVAWVRDDYGAGQVSQEFYQGKIHDHQRALHDQTRETVNTTVGPWADYESSGSMLNMKDIQVQWVEKSSAEQAAAAFIRINEGGTVIDSLEVRILRAKRSALSTATRIIARGGTGHEYWKHFEDEAARDSAPKLGAEIYKLLYDPPLELPIKTTDLPLGGFGYGSGALRFAFDLVGLVNDLPVPDSTQSKAPDTLLSDDMTGKETIKYLQNTKRAISLILSNHESSLGLHTALYFYTGGGTFQPAAVHNVMAWVLELEKRGKLQQFSDVRGVFEILMLAHPAVVKPSTHRLGSGRRTRSKMVSVLERMFELLTKNPDPEKAWKKLAKEFPHLVADEKEEREKSEKGKPGGKFSRGAKSSATLSELENVPICKLCGGLMHRNGKVSDHKHERSAGGSSAGVNARWVHPKCNSDRKKTHGQAA